MGIIKLIERVFLGRRTFEGKEKTIQEIRDIKEERRRNEHRKEMLAACDENKAIDEKAVKIRKESWAMIRQIKKGESKK